jgi:hypothetical protein
MEKILMKLRTRAALLRKAIAKAEKDARDEYPEGHLRVSSTGHRIRYYQILEKGDTQGVYIPRGSEDIARKLAKKDYNDHFLKSAKDELESIEWFAAKIERDNADLVFAKLSPKRKELLVPYICTDEMYINEWLKKPFKLCTYRSEEKVYETKRGETVRSKSEAIIADILLEMGVPYLYEKPLTLKNGNIRYPDFTLLKTDTREEIYLEHFGLLSEAEYLRKCLNKLDEYRHNGIYPGKNLIFTYESEEAPLDIKGIRNMLRDLFN